MKSTGIIRRIDELGRVVIPKEIRRALNIRNGDFLEIFCEDSTLSLRKFSEIENVKSVFEGLVLAAAQGTGETVLVCDRERFVCAAGPLAKKYTDRLIGPKLAAFLDGKERSEDIALCADEKAEVCQVIVPVAKNGELYGGCVLLSDRNMSGECLTVFAKTIAAYLSDLLYE